MSIKGYPMLPRMTKHSIGGISITMLQGQRREMYTM